MQYSSQDKLYTHVEVLTSIKPSRSYLNVQSLLKTKAYIQDQLNDYGLLVEEQHWMASGQTYTNVIASYRPELQKRLIVGAHYDVCGDQPGADDNASAVAGILETARLITVNKPDLSFGIDFVAYCLEEPPFFATREMGSYIHAKSIESRKEDILGMICYEMIGYFSDEPGSQPFPDPALAALYPDTANFIIVVGTERFGDFASRFHQKMAQDAAIDVQKIIFNTEGDLAGLSDHRNYWHFGIPALMINDTSFIRNPHYHEKSDTIDTLDFPKMVAVVDAAYNAIINWF